MTESPDTQPEAAPQTDTPASAATAPQPTPPDTKPAKDDHLALDIIGLAHRFKDHHALTGVTFSVARQSIHGFVGPNGAGKTTTLKIVATLMPPQTGTVRVMGMDVAYQKRHVRQRIGFMPDHFSMYRQMTVFEYLDFFGAAYGLSLGNRNKIIDDVLALTDMDGRRHAQIKGLSRGMQQRVSLARVLINDPDLLLLDEPASGLDPRARIELMEILRELRRLGKTIFISSHILSELATLCDSVTIIDRGAVQYTGSMEGLLSHGDDVAAYTVTLHEPCPAGIEAIRAIPGVETAQQRDELPVYTVLFDPAQTDTGSVVRALLEHDAKLVSFEPSKKHLDQAFMDLTQAGVRS